MVRRVPQEIPELLVVQATLGPQVRQLRCLVIRFPGVQGALGVMQVTEVPEVPEVMQVTEVQVVLAARGV